MDSLQLQHRQQLAPPTSNFATSWMSARTLVYRYLLILRRRWWMVLATTSIGLAVAAWFASQLPPSFLTESRMMVSGKMNLQEGSLYMEEVSNFYGTQMELMQSGEVQARAIDRVKALHPELGEHEVTLAVNQQPRTSLFSFTAISSSGEFARAFLDAVMDEYIATKHSMRTEKSEGTFKALSAELTSVEEELKAARDRMLDFQAKNNLGYLKEEGNSAGSYLTSLNRQYAVLKTEYQLLESLSLDQALDREPAVPQNSGGVAVPQERTLSSFGPMSDYLRSKQQLKLLEADRERMARIKRPKHPDMIQLEDEIARISRLIEIFQKQSLEQIQDRRASIGLQMKNMEGAIKEWEVKATDLSRKLAEYERLRANVDSLQVIADRVSNNLRNVDLSKAVDQDTISILEHAAKAHSIRPGLAKLLFSGFGGGLAFGLLLLFLMERIDDRISSLLDIQNHFREMILAQIVHQETEGPLALLRPNDQRHAFAESFRSLRSSILLLPGEHDKPKLILVTSAIPGEGKSTTASNLAVVLAAAGGRTLLVDADLRRGGLHRLFGLDSGVGLSDILQGAIPWTEAVITTPWTNLSLIGRGSVLQQPGEFLLSALASRFFRESREAYDFVIVDSAPIMVAEDTASVAHQADAVVVVLRFNVSSSRLSQRTLSRLKERRANVIGLVLNEISSAMPEYGYYYYGGDYYGEEKKKGPLHLNA